MRLLFQETRPIEFDVLLKAGLEFRSNCSLERQAYVGWLCGQVQADCSDYSAAIESVRAGRTAALGQNDYQGYEANNRHLRTHLLYAGRWREFLMECSRSIEAATRNGANIYLDVINLQLARLSLECFDHDSTLELVQGIQPVRDYIAHKLAVLNAMVYVRRKQGELALRTAAEGLNVGGGCIELRQRLNLEHARIEALLVSHRLAEALSVANAYQRIVHSTREKTYHALTWELIARIHLANGDTRLACDAIGAGLKITQNQDLPLVGWKVSATASVVYHASGRYGDAACHRNLGLAAIQRLAAELDAEPRLKKKFETGATRCLSPATAICGASGALLSVP
jgi:hypothetical protein